MIAAEPWRLRRSSRFASRGGRPAAVQQKRQLDRTVVLHVGERHDLVITGDENRRQTLTVRDTEKLL